MPEILDLSNGIENMKGYIYDTIKLDSYYGKDRYVFDTCYEMLTDLKKNLFEIQRVYEHKLEQKKSDFARKYIVSKPEIVEKFKEKILSDDNIEISDSFQNVICQYLEEIGDGDIERIREAVYLVEDKKISTLKNNLIERKIILGDVNFKMVMNEILKLDNSSYAKFIVDVYNGYIKK